MSLHCMNRKNHYNENINNHVYILYSINTLGLKQNGRHAADDIVKWNLLNEIVAIVINP